MNNEDECNAPEFSDPIVEPLLVIYGEGSGQDLTVGNEEKKKMFFFGQPGCLKLSPIKTNPSENHNNHKAAETSNAHTAMDKFNDSENHKKSDAPASDDDDGSALLQKISDALKDEPDRICPEDGTEIIKLILYQIILYFLFNFRFEIFINKFSFNSL